MKKLRRSRPAIPHQVSQNHRNVVDQMSPYVSAASLYEAGHLLQMSLFADLADSSSLWAKGIQLTHSYQFQVTSALNLFCTARGQKSKQKKIPSKLEVAPPPKCGLGEWVIPLRLLRLLEHLRC